MSIIVGAASRRDSYFPAAPPERVLVKILYQARPDGVVEHVEDDIIQALTLANGMVVILLLPNRRWKLQEIFDLLGRIAFQTVHHLRQSPCLQFEDGVQVVGHEQCSS